MPASPAPLTRLPFRLCVPLQHFLLRVYRLRPPTDDRPCHTACRETADREAQERLRLAELQARTETWAKAADKQRLAVAKATAQTHALIPPAVAAAVQVWAHALANTYAFSAPSRPMPLLLLLLACPCLPSSSSSSSSKCFHKALLTPLPCFITDFCLT